MCKEIFFQIFLFTILIVKSIGSSEPYLDILKHYQQNVDLSDLCSDNLGKLKIGYENREIWALKVLDVSGKKSNDFTLGNNFWLGSGRGCDQLNDPPRIHLRPSASRKMHENITSIRSEIPVVYRMFRIAHTSSIQFDIDLFNQSVIHVGLCFPKQCSNDDVDEIGMKIFVPIILNDETVYGNVSYKSSRVLGLRDDFMNENFVRMLIITVIFFGSLVTLGTIYTSLTRQKKSKRKAAGHNNNNNEQCCTKNDFSTKINLHYLNFDELKKKKKIADRFWHCFALQKNNAFIMSSRLSKDSLPPIHGIRTFGILWIIIGHMYYYAAASFDNLQLAFSYGESLALQPFFAAALSVDSFYTISGFLLAYAFYEKQKKRPSRSLAMDVVKGTINRYIRIAPCFMILMLFAVTFSIILNDTSQFLPVENIEVNCKNYWWRNMLFIQNMYPLSEMCLSWSWYVSTDFQLFIIASIILAISMKNMKLSALISLIIVAICSMYSGYVGIQQSFAFSLDVQYKSVDALYTKPYTRAAQYITGVWAGYFLSKVNRQWRVRKMCINLGWALSIFTLLFLVFIQIYKETNFFVSFVFPAVGRILWSLPICFIIFAGSTQFNEGFIAKILNSKLLLPFSRMSFSAYLLNPLIVMVLTFSCETSFHLDFYSMAVYIAGFYLITYFAAYLFMLLFENPIIMFVRAYIAN